jgi:sugar lactone lactonase YvrE
MNKALRFALVLSLLTAAAAAQSTHSWEQSKLEELEKGTSKGVSIRSDGALELAPAFRQIGATSSTYLWSAASDAEGNLYAAAGSPARVYRITPKGEVSVIFAASELQVQALAVDRAGTIYAATSPDGRVYRIVHSPIGTAGMEPPTVPAPAEKPPAYNEQVSPNYISSVYFDPKTKYIWALAIDSQGRLYVATGDHGEIFRVEKDGASSVFFKSDEAHIRAIALDRDGNLIAGSDGSGLIYRINPAGQSFVLYGAPKKEITALAMDSRGNIYAAGSGEKRQASPLPSVPAGSAAPATGAVTMLAPAAPGARPAAPATPAVAPPPMPVPGLSVTGSEIYRIAPDGSPKRIWRSREGLVYALAFDHSGRLIAGTGNKGKIYAIADNGEFTELVKASANQVTGFAPAPNGGIYAVCSNLGKVFLMEDSSQREGTYDSDVFDARIFSRWGRAEMRGQGLVELYARSGNVDNPDRNWSPWSKIDFKGGAETKIPPARYAQWRAVLNSGVTVPRVHSVRLYYLPNNVAPEVDDVTVQVARPASAIRPEAGSPNPSVEVLRPTRNDITVHWTAHDDNGDQLRFSIYYRGDGESRWLLLKKDIRERSYAFDPNLIPDGGYTIRVVASDGPSHAPAEALTGWKDSAHFEVDTTPPRIENLNAALAGDRLHITFSATDSFSVIQRAEYSIDAESWQFVAPVGGISDSRTESYDFSVTAPAQHEPPGELPSTDMPAHRRGRHSASVVGAAPRTGAPQSASVALGGAEEHIVIVRVYDRADNMATAKMVVRAGR